MMTHASAASPDPVAAALAIARTARRRADRADDAEGFAVVTALAIGIALAFAVIAVMISAPATIPMWCAAHGGCP
ncbi:MAG TPA: hypothetical protein VGC96_03845 [Candidatus Elarobacter sp.]|jgi:hypothetical protein